MTSEVEKMSKILIFGGSGYIGSYIVRASISMGYPTYAYCRPITPYTIPSKLDLYNDFESMGVTVVHGELNDEKKLVSLIEKVDIVISTLAYPQILDQLHIIHAIKLAGNIKRFLPSDFGVEEDRVTPLPPFEAFLDKKRQVRRAIEAAGIPYTFVSANCFGAYFVNYLLHPHDPQDDIKVYGTGHAKAVLNYEKDIATYTIRVANDPRACNRVVIYRPQKNILSQLELISLWEKKTSRTFNKIHIPEAYIVKLSETLPCPDNIPVSILHSIFLQGSTMGFELEENDVEATKLYPDFEYTSIDQLLDIFLVDPPKATTAAFE